MLKDNENFACKPTCSKCTRNPEQSLSCEVIVWKEIEEDAVLDNEPPTHNEIASFPDLVEQVKISQILDDRSQHMGAIIKHLLACDKCCPNEVLRRYLGREDRPMGLVLPRFANITVEYRAWLSTELNEGLIAELLIRAGNRWKLSWNRHLLTDDQFIRGIRYFLVDTFLKTSRLQSFQVVTEDDRAIMAACEAYHVDNGPPPKEENFKEWLQEAIAVYDVMNS